MIKKVKMKKIPIIIIMFFTFQWVHAQNMIPSSDTFYDISDTSIAIQSYFEAVPLLGFVNPDIQDSVESFVAKAMPNLVDSAGYSFTLALQCKDQDSSHIHVYFRTHSNLTMGHYYYMREYRSSYTCEKDVEYTYGCIRVGEYYIFVVVPKYLAESEISSLFRKKHETQKIYIHRIREELIPLFDDPKVICLPHTHFVLKLQDYHNYVSPRCD